MTKSKCASLLLLGCCLSILPLTAQVVKVDITPAHATNHFVPKQTLGAGIDRIQTVAIDKLMNKTIFDRVFTAGWQPVTYRQNTELAIEAWHWNPDRNMERPKRSAGIFHGIVRANWIYSTFIWLCVAASGNYSRRGFSYRLLTIDGRRYLDLLEK